MEQTKELPLTLHSRMLLECDAADLFRDDGIDWRYCAQHASFTHREACEFALYCYPDDEPSFREELHRMEAFRCSRTLIATFRAANEKGARFLLLYA